MTGRFVSFDVWDTLLRRRCDPEAVKLFTCHTLLLLHMPAVEVGWHDAWKLLSLRHSIEQNLAGIARRDGHDGEYTLTDVLLGWLRRCVRAGASEDRLAAMAAQLQRTELAQELFVAYADPGIAAIIADNAGASMGFLSDYYMPTEDVARLLMQNGFGDIAGRGLVSGDVKLSKRSGRLYDFARQAWSIGSSDWLHVGDDPAADVDMARRAGVRALHYSPDAEGTERRRKELLLGRPHRALNRVCRSIEETTANQVGAVGDPSTSWRLLGARSAPLLAGFALWCLEQSLAGGIDRIEHTGRQGGFLARAYLEVSSCFADAWPVPAGSSFKPAAAARAEGTGRTALVDAFAGTDPGGSTLSASEAVCRQLSLLAEPDAYLPELRSGALDRGHEALLALCGEATDGSGAGIQLWQQAALDATAAIARELRTHVITSDDLRPFAIDAWHEIVDAADRQMSAPVHTRVVSGRRAHRLKQAMVRAKTRPSLWGYAVPLAIRAKRRLRMVRNCARRMR